MEWKHTRKNSKPAEVRPARKTAFGTLPGRKLAAMPTRHYYSAAAEGTSWAHVERELVQFWVKLCEVLPAHDQGPERQRRWNQIVCVIDALYGTIHSRLARDGTPLPAGEETAFLAVKVPLAAETERRLSAERGAPVDAGLNDPWSAGMKELDEAMRRALVGASEREPAKSALAALRAWQPFALAAERPGDPTFGRSLPSRDVQVSVAVAAVRAKPGG